MVKGTVKRKGTIWKEVLRARNEISKSKCVEVYREEKRKLKSVYMRAKRK